VCKKPITWNDPMVQDICNRYKDPSVKWALELQLEKDQKIEWIHTCCCYCECVVGWWNWDDIEHVIPKSKSPQDSLKWDNLLLACNTCNRSNKNDNYTPWFLNVSNPWYLFEEHFEYWKLNDKFLLSAKSSEWESTLIDLKEFKFDSHTSTSRYEVYWKLYIKIRKEKEKGKSKKTIVDELREFIWIIWKNYTFSIWLISDDPNSPLYSELY
jgi:5-methylcytosine-specific restriction endonuclease McrA